MDMSAPDFMKIHPIVEEKFNYKAKMSTSCLEENQGMNKVIRIHPLGIVHICTKFYGNPFPSLLQLNKMGNSIAESEHRGEIQLLLSK